MNRHMYHPRDPVSSITHLAGAIFFALGTILLLVRTTLRGGGAIDYVAASAFGLSLMALYSASAAYHHVSDSQRIIGILRKLDHSMIYLLIAGSYTPILLKYYPIPSVYTYLAVVWGVAAAGISLRFIWWKAPRWLYTLSYLLMGWMIMLEPQIILSIPTGAFALLLAGGLSYTAGGIIYAIKKPNISKAFGFHELFHVFVLLGSLCHYLLVFIYVV